MTNQEKARLYDDYIRESDRLQRENSKLKSENITNTPPKVEKQIKENEKKISVLVGKVEGLFRM